VRGFTLLLCAAILRQEIGWFDQDENNSSLVASRLSVDATLVRASVGDRMSVILMTLALLILAFGIAFYLDWRVAFVVFGTYPFMVGAFVGEVIHRSWLQLFGPHQTSTQDDHRMLMFVHFKIDL
jgi:ABC-type multidrug transport system fused ATPase/permease subunit